MAQGRAATIEELEQVRTEMQRLIIRSEVVSQDTFRLTTQLAELMEMTERRFDLVDERFEAFREEVRLAFARLVVAVAEQIAASEQRMMRYVNETVATQIAASEQRMMRHVNETVATQIAASEQRMMRHVSEQIAASEQRIINAILGLTVAKN